MGIVNGRVKDTQAQADTWRLLSNDGRGGEHAELMVAGGGGVQGEF